MLPLLVLLLISSVLLSTPKFDGAMANPHGWLSGFPLIRVFTNVPASVKMSIYPPAPPLVAAKAT